MRVCVAIADVARVCISRSAKSCVLFDVVVVLLRFFPLLVVAAECALLNEVMQVLHS